ncbi:MAG: universal stress protein [Anaerolineae bacterium]|nr:universal stress protein [Anaerolineae bacterium]
MGYRRILVTLDGSTFAEQALKHVVEIAATGAQIRLLSVMAEDPISEVAALAKATNQTEVEGKDQWPVLPKPKNIHAVDARREYLEKAGEWLEQMEYSVSTDVRSGEVIPTILEVARKGFDVIVMATHNRSEKERMVVGSVTAGVLANAPCPVLAIGPLNLKSSKR